MSSNAKPTERLGAILLDGTQTVNAQVWAMPAVVVEKAVMWVLKNHGQSENLCVNMDNVTERYLAERSEAETTTKDDDIWGAIWQRLVRGEMGTASESTKNYIGTTFLHYTQQKNVVAERWGERLAPLNEHALDCLLSVYHGCGSYLPIVRNATIQKDAIDWLKQNFSVSSHTTKSVTCAVMLAVVGEKLCDRDLLRNVTGTIMADQVLGLLEYLPQHQRQLVVDSIGSGTTTCTVIRCEDVERLRCYVDNKTLGLMLSDYTLAKWMVNSPDCDVSYAMGRCDGRKVLQWLRAIGYTGNELHYDNLAYQHLGGLAQWLQWLHGSGESSMQKRTAACWGKLKEELCQQELIMFDKLCQNYTGSLKQAAEMIKACGV